MSQRFESNVQDPGESVVGLEDPNIEQSVDSSVSTVDYSGDNESSFALLFLLLECQPGPKIRIIYIHILCNI